MFTGITVVFHYSAFDLCCHSFKQISNKNTHTQTVVQTQLRKPIKILLKLISKNLLIYFQNPHLV